jgi:chromosome segregation ATPase
MKDKEKIKVMKRDLVILREINELTEHMHDVEHRVGGFSEDILAYEIRLLSLNDTSEHYAEDRQYYLEELQDARDGLKEARHEWIDALDRLSTLNGKLSATFDISSSSIS